MFDEKPFKVDLTADVYFVHFFSTGTTTADTYRILMCYNTKKKVHSCGEIEDFVETHIFELCVILRSRVSLGVCPHSGYRSENSLGTTE